jgi:hypothetical protein
MKAFELLHQRRIHSGLQQLTISNIFVSSHQAKILRRGLEGTSLAIPVLQYCCIIFNHRQYCFKPKLKIVDDRPQTMK